MKAKFLFLIGAALALFSSLTMAAPWVIAIDPGHGGKDPGAIGRNLKIYEKNITLSIARELQALLDKDPNFKGVLTRRGDYYISVPERSEIARRYKANFLISIHADSSTNPELRGASVWVLSNRRANDEMGQWLEDDEKRSELLGGAGKVLSHNNDKYLDQTVLDLQFGHSQRTGYQLGSNILRRFARVTSLSRNTPQHASLGVLRSPDIPSVLVETGFLSNMEEEQKLNTPAYRRRIAYMIYEGLVAFRNGNLKSIVAFDEEPENSKENAKKDTAKNEKTAKNDENSGFIRHQVKNGESLGGLANRYEVKIADIVALNNLKRKELWVGETLKIPAKNKAKADKKDNTDAKNTSKEDNSAKENTSVKDSGLRHKVKKGENLSELAEKYQVKSADILALNKLKRNELWVGETLKIPENGKKPSEEKKAPEKVTEKNDKKAADKKADKADKKAAEKTDKKADDKKKADDNSKADKKSAKNDSKIVEAKPAKANAKEPLPQYHVMAKDQTLYAVSRQYNVPMNTLLKLNPQIKNGKVIAGQKIKLKDK